MFGFKIVTETEYASLVEEVSYWREAAEKERKRADAFQEKVLQLNGLPPMVVEEGTLEMHAPVGVRKQLEQMMEFMNEEIHDELEIEAEEPAVAEVKE